MLKDGKWPKDTGGEEVFEKLIAMIETYDQKRNAFEKFESEFRVAMRDKIADLGQPKDILRKEYWEEYKRLQMDYNLNKESSAQIDLEFHSKMQEQMKKLIAPEQERLRNEMFKAIEKVCSLIFS